MPFNLPIDIPFSLHKQTLNEICWRSVMRNFHSNLGNFQEKLVSNERNDVINAEVKYS